MSSKSKKQLLDSLSKKRSNYDIPEILNKFNFKTSKKNQLLTFFKPEVFLDKTLEQTEKIIDFVFKKLEEYNVSIDGTALYPGPSIGKYSIMDRHYGVINTLSKNASKILGKEERDIIYSTLNIKDNNTKILGGHEAFEISGMDETYEFDNYWLSTPSTKIKSGFYVRVMKIKDEEVVVVNGFHPHQLAHYTETGRYLGVMLVSSDTPWSILRTEMLGETFPEKALPKSIRGYIYNHKEDFGFKKVGIENNIVHLSAGPTEALFEMDNFLNRPFGIDIIKERAKLADLLMSEGLNEEKIKDILTDKELHSILEHKDSSEAVKIIKERVS